MQTFGRFVQAFQRCVQTLGGGVQAFQPQDAYEAAGAAKPRISAFIASDMAAWVVKSFSGPARKHRKSVSYRSHIIVIPLINK